MSFLKELMSGASQGLLTGVKDIVQEFHLSPIDQKELEIKLQQVAADYETKVLAAATADNEAKKEIIIAELSQADLYTKRARPSVIYYGLAIIFFNYSFVPLCKMFLTDLPDLTPFELPDMFWMAWGGIAGTWVVGRSAEKLGYKNKLLTKITGN